MRTAKSYCRLCLGFCGMDVTVDDNDRVVKLRGDKDNPASQGYACIKGLEAHHGLYGDKRFLTPMKRVDGELQPIGVEQALDEIAEKMIAIRDEHGTEAMAFFRGTGTFGSNAAVFSIPNLADAVSGQRFSTMTIDQSAKWVANERLGQWNGGKQDFETADTWIFAGMNPLVSVFSWDTPVQNPTKAMKRAKDRDMKIVLIDPRASEMADYATVHLQLYPGEDAAVAAGLLHIILQNNWHDAEFCAAHVDGLDALRTALAPFTPDMVAERAGVSADDLIAAARIFADEGKRGNVSTGTGVDMARFPNLAEHLYRCIEIICGRFLREGEVLPNPGVLFKKRAKAQVDGPTRAFESKPRSRVRGAAQLNGERATPTLAEEILTPGEGQIRSLLVSGANPVMAVPDSGKVAEAFKVLELLVVIEPYQTETTRLAHYVLPPTMLYEHTDFTFGLEMSNLTIPYTQYTEAVVPPPAGSDLRDEGYYAWALAKRLGGQMQIMGADMDMETPPENDDFLRMMARFSSVPFEEVQRRGIGGELFPDIPENRVQPADDKAGRFVVMPDDVAAETAAFAASPSEAETMGTGSEYPFRLIARRIRETSNTSCKDFPSARKRMAFNPLAVNPDDLAQLGLDEGAMVKLRSDNAEVSAKVIADPTMKPGVVSMTHGFGGFPGEDVDYLDRGASTSILVSLDRDCADIQAMPRMTGIPVSISALTG